MTVPASSFAALRAALATVSEFGDDDCSTPAWLRIGNLAADLGAGVGPLPEAANALAWAVIYPVGATIRRERVAALLALPPAASPRSEV